MLTKLTAAAAALTVTNALNLGTAEETPSGNTVDIDIQFHVDVGEETAEEELARLKAEQEAAEAAEAAAAAQAAAEAAAAAQAAAETAAQELADEAERQAQLAAEAAAEAARQQQAAEDADNAADAEAAAAAAQAAADAAQAAADAAQAAADASEIADAMAMADEAAADALAAQASADAAQALADQAAIDAGFMEDRDCPPQNNAWNACNDALENDADTAQFEINNAALLQDILEGELTTTVVMAGGDVDALRAALLDDMRFAIENDAADFTVIDDESNPQCVDDIEIVAMCPTNPALQATTTSLIQENNEVRNFNLFLQGYECNAISTLLSQTTESINNAVADVEELRDNQILTLKVVEGNEDSLSDYTAALEARYDAAVGDGCYTEKAPADFSLPEVPESLEDCDTAALEAALIQAANDLDADARFAAFNLFMFAMAEPANNCDGN